MVFFFCNVFDRFCLHCPHITGGEYSFLLWCPRLDWCYLSLKSFGISSEVELSLLADGWDAWGGWVKGDPKVWGLGKRGTCGDGSWDEESWGGGRRKGEHQLGAH